MTGDWRRRGLTIAAGIALTAFLACGGGTEPSDPQEPDPPDPPAPTVASITVSLDESSVEAGTTTTATAEARDAQGNVMQTSFSWSTDAPGVASVSGGTVRGIVPGTAAIRASSGSVVGSASLEVRIRNIDSIVESIRAADGLPAMAGALVTRDGIVAMGVAGTRRASGADAATLDDVWHIGSNLKAITAALAAVAVDEGAIEWTTTVEESFPELAGAIRDEYREVTLRDLLTNAGGIRNDPPGAAYAGATPRAQRESVVAWALGADPIGEVGDYYYSNPGFVTAGAMIERALGGVYEDLIASEIAAPLGVEGIGWGPTTTAGGTDQPVGHSLQGGTWVPCEACDNPPGLSAAGRAHMPLGTWARIIRGFLEAYDGSSGWLSAGAAGELFEDHTPIPSSSDSYGMGWVMTERSWGGRTAYHAGSNLSNYSLAWVGLDTGVALLTVTNADDPAGGSSRASLSDLITRLLELHQTGN